jgi:hypothetical protein
MDGAAIRTMGLSKRFGEVEALAPLDLEVAHPGRRAGPRPRSQLCSQLTPALSFLEPGATALAGDRDSPAP